MKRPIDRHLDSDELDALVSLQVPGVTASQQVSEEAVREAQRHVESCSGCDRKLQMHRSMQHEISRPGSSKVAKGPNCPDETVWTGVAAGLLVETEARRHMNHAAQCGYCGPLLKVVVTNLSEETTQDEEVALANLSSARPDWQTRMANTLRTAGEPRAFESSSSFWESIFRWPAPALATAVLGLLALASWIGVRMLRQPSAEQLLGQSYTERRTIEVRIAEAKYAPLHIERRGAGSNFDKPQSLLRAEALISEQLRQNPNDPTWLGAKARAELLDGTYDDAIKTLQRALESNPDSPALLTDLGSAYFLRAESANRPADYGDAIQSFGSALAKVPDDPIALFNRALACEQVFLYTQAIDDWEHYLRIDPQGEWSEEARAHLVAVKEKLRRHREGRLEPLLEPAQIAKAGPDNVELQGKIDERIEQYLHLAITDWLSQAFSRSSGRASLDARAALLELSRISQTRHADTWLADLLSGPTAGQFPSGVEALASAVRANDRGDYAEGQRSAHMAGSMFAAAANTTGQLRAQAEEVYSDHLLWEGPRCIGLLKSMSPLLERSGYTWIQAQMSLERSNCANAVGDLGTYQSAITTGLSQAREHKYLALYLRALGFQALALGSAGDSNAAFSLTMEGLNLYWSRRVDLIKGYNLYFNLESVVEPLRLPYFQVALLREATALIDGHPDVLQRAMAHRWYGNAAYLANLPQLAASEYSKASELLAASPRTEATIRDYVDAEVWRAHAEIAQGDLEHASARLRAIQSTLDNAPSFDPEIGFYTAQADIAMQRGDSDAAESAIRSAVYLAEWALTSYLSNGDRRQWAEQTRTTYREAVEWKLRQGGPTSALELWEWYRGAEVRASDLPSSAPPELGTDNPPDAHDAPPLPTPAAVAQRLPLLHDQTAVVYAVFPDGISIWAYDDRGIVSRWASKPYAQIEELVLRFERLCSDRNSDLVTLRTTANTLYGILIAPIENQFVPGRTILFEPDDTLAGVPWGALVDDNSHYLGERVPIVVSPGLYRTLQLRSAIPITQNARVLVVSIPSTKDEAPLSDADDEAQAVSGKFSSARWLQGTRATLAAIHREIRGASVFHFAGHAVASPVRSGLLLAEIDSKSQHSRLVTAESFASHDIESLQLAVLSACRTGREVQLGTGTESLVGALLGSGVPHVVASLWDVDSRQTAQFMNEFYAHLLDGNDAALSLHTAQMALASRPSSAHPYYWSAFELRGSQ